MSRSLTRIRVLAALAALLLAGTAQAARRAPVSHPSRTSTARPAPRAFGETAYTVTALSDLAFTPFSTSQAYDANVDDYFRYFTGAGGSFVTGAVIPAGAVIDYVGLGSCDPSGAAFFVYVFEVTDDGAFSVISEFPSTAHACTTEYNAEVLGYVVQGNAGRTIQVEVFQEETAPVDGSARFGSVEIWWHRAVSPAPEAATFGDVPTDHPFFQFIEALAASGITGGCGSGNYCPDAPLTRGQVAVFLSKALGLHWPGNPQN